MPREAHHITSTAAEAVASLLEAAVAVAASNPDAASRVRVRAADIAAGDAGNWSDPAWIAATGDKVLSGAWMIAIKRAGSVFCDAERHGWQH